MQKVGLHSAGGRWAADSPGQCMARWAPAWGLASVDVLLRNHLQSIGILCAQLYICPSEGSLIICQEALGISRVPHSQSSTCETDQLQSVLLIKGYAGSYSVCGSYLINVVHFCAGLEWVVR